jgi:hypothetical protein
MTLHRRYTVFAADQAGNTWDVGTYHEPLTALWVLEAQRNLKPMLRFDVIDADDPWRRNFQTALEDMLEGDMSYLAIIEAAVRSTTMRVIVPLLLAASVYAADTKVNITRVQHNVYLDNLSKSYIYTRACHEVVYEEDATLIWSPPKSKLLFNDGHTCEVRQ